MCMELLLVAGTSNDIFIYNYAKWLKKTMDCRIDVFEFSPSAFQGYDSEFYDHVQTARSIRFPVAKIRRTLNVFVNARSLKHYLQGRHYDVIHVQRVLPPFVLQKGLKDHCSKLVMTFWGGEFSKETILFSSRLYRHYLERISKEVDCIINSSSNKESILKQLPAFKGSYKAAMLGSAPLEALYSLMETESKDESKRRLGMPEDKLSVMIGYSGKLLHRHIPIIRELVKYPSIKERIHILAPMTRGSKEDYVAEVGKELEESGFSYTLISGRFLSDEDMARVRNATDIALQLSEWDGFSRSIVECLCAGSVLVYGKWLEYGRLLSPAGLEGIEVDSIGSGVAALASIVDNMDAYKEMAVSNHENGRHQGLWSECIKDWVEAYKELFEE